MVRWLGHAFYNPSLRHLVWSTYPASPPLWLRWSQNESLFPSPDPTVASSRGQMIHALPWGTTQGAMALAWVNLVAGPVAGMESFNAPSDKGEGRVLTINQVLHSATPHPLRGTVDGAVALGNVWTGVEVKTGAWKYAPFWEKQIARHLMYYPHLLLVVVTPDAAQGKTPALVHLTS